MKGIAERKEKIALDILSDAADTLAVSFRASGYALSSLTYVGDFGISSLQTDGVTLTYSPDFIINSFTEDKNNVPHLLLHSLFHCLFRHLYHTQQKDRVLWDAACDISAENAIWELQLPCVKTPHDGVRETALLALHKKLKTVTADSVYTYFRRSSITAQELASYQSIFSPDSHAPWYKTMTGEIADDPYSQEAETPSIYTFADDRPSRGEDKEGRTSGDTGQTVSDENRDRWERIARRTKWEMEVLTSQYGVTAGQTVTELTDFGRDKLDYTAFLRQFCRNTEAMETDPNEFDYIYYTYGMQLYGNVPLIEPLEYREAEKIGELYIAIDTSGSVQGDTVRKFIEATFRILENTESFFEKTKVHILQCDAAIQDDFTVQSHRDLEEYRANLQLRGFGGTDFRPVFDYIKQRLAQRQVRKINGLLYFTDGDGRYPDFVPPYKTAFLLTNPKNTGKVPIWSAKMILKPEQFETVLG